MSSLYGEFLSLTRIDSAVDELYKAYLEAVLIRLKDYSTDYRAEVAKFRMGALDPSPLPTGQPYYGTDLELKPATEYLYWFDIRAKFWANTEVTPRIRSMVAPIGTLLKLVAEAKDLQEQRDLAVQARTKKGAPDPGAGKSMAVSGNPPSEGMATLFVLASSPK